ncbi:MAG: Mut7-C RNAse domain-containing protein [Nitrospiraceae bacterium]|nr:Mut7-C RNAse domain-containing protein [Nitrospiraceae bacterium]
MKFIADSMLGRLAKWLRLIGFDVFYFSDIDDNTLLRISKQENRIILTRDTHFLKRRNFSNYLFIKSNNTKDQFSEVLNVYGFADLGSSRCVKCNGILIVVNDKDSIRAEIPEHIYVECNKFQRCDICSSIYWEGSHIKRFRETALSLIKKNK